MGKQVKHRGPDWSGNHIANNTILVHERLSIVGVGMTNIPPVDNVRRMLTDSTQTPAHSPRQQV